MSEKNLCHDPAGEAILQQVARGKELYWSNPHCGKLPLPVDAPTSADIDDAALRLERFSPYLYSHFPETRPDHGRIESPLREIPSMLRAMDCGLPGRLFLKMDSHLAIAGSVKARGGIYEVLRHAEELALAEGCLQLTDDYAKLDTGAARRFFSRYSVQVGSTGNLGVSIGIISAALGFRAVVHMSRDAVAWKKDLLRRHGVTVIEYEGDYGAAVAEGRKRAAEDPRSYFVDDEHSRHLFLGYAVAAGRLRAQLREAGVTVDAEHPLFVYLPCGVGGAPGGISFGLKQCFGEHVHCFFVEPTQAPCMLLGLASGLHDRICIQDIGLSGVTRADGLAVGRPSGFVCRTMEPLLSGEFTVRDGALFDSLRMLVQSEDIFIEPSACAAFAGPQRLLTEAKAYLGSHALCGKLPHATHIVWATGGSLVPAEMRREYLATHC